MTEYSPGFERNMNQDYYRQTRRSRPSYRCSFVLRMKEIKKWDRGRIFDALMRETTISEDAASIASREVEKTDLRAWSST